MPYVDGLSRLRLAERANPYPEGCTCPRDGERRPIKSTHLRGDFGLAWVMRCGVCDGTFSFQVMVECPTWGTFVPAGSTMTLAEGWVIE